MNIIVRPYGSSICECRPDTTWERENKDFYSPECVDELYWSPVLFARICKAGKCVGRKFVERYYDGVGFGALIYCKVGEGMTSSADHTSLLPHPLYNPVILDNQENTFTVLKEGKVIFRRNISIGSFPSTEFGKQENRGNVSRISAEGNEENISMGSFWSAESGKQGIWGNVSRISADQNELELENLASDKERIEDGICTASVLTSLRIGDLVAVELAPMELLATRGEGSVEFKAVFCENDLYDLKLVF